MERISNLGNLRSSEMAEVTWEGTHRGDDVIVSAKLCDASTDRNQPVDGCNTAHPQFQLLITVHTALSNARVMFNGFD